MSKLCKVLHGQLAWDYNAVRYFYNPNHKTLHDMFIAYQGGEQVETNPKVPENGVYIMFEKGETVKHEGTPEVRDRIVRIGINRESGNLLERLKKHYTGKMRQSVFRKHVGSCFLNPNNPEYRPEYETNEALLEKRVSEYIQNNITFSILTIGDEAQSSFKESVKSDFFNPNHPNYRPEYESDKSLLEKKLSEYLQNSIVFSMMSLNDKVDRENIERKLIATVAQCEECQPSPNWLGRYCKEPKISNGKLWNVQGLNAEPLTNEDIAFLILPNKIDT